MTRCLSLLDLGAQRSALSQPSLDRWYRHFGPLFPYLSGLTHWSSGREREQHPPVGDGKHRRTFPTCWCRYSGPFPASINQACTRSHTFQIASFLSFFLLVFTSVM